MRKPVAAATSLAWFVALGGTFGCLLPYLLNYWHFHQPLPYWWIARAVGALLICGGLIPLLNSFAEFFKAGGTPVPVASPPVLVVSGFYRYVRNPIYVGFTAVLIGQALLFGSRPAGVRRSGMGGRGRRCPLVRGTRADPQVRRRVPGIPARRSRLDTANEALDSPR